MKNSNISKKLTGVAILLAIFMSYPVISIVDSEGNIHNSLNSLGFIFLAWFITILIVATIVNSNKKAKP